MKPWPLLVLPLSFMASNVGAADAVACPPGVTCVPPEDMKVFVQLLKDQKCREETPPKLTADPVTIVVDKEGRIYGSGSDPYPYKLHIDWCNYKVEVTSQVKLVAAQRVEPISGFRFRPKATIGFLPLTALNEKSGYSGLDAGVLLEPFFLSWANVNAYVGFRSVGAGLGFDITKNMGLYVGYAITWGTWQSNPHAAISFALW